MTGAGRRIGRVIALSLAEAGANVAVHYNTSRIDAEETVQTIRAVGGTAESFQADLSDYGRATGLADAVRSHFGSFDLLINSASAFGTGRFEETTKDEWDYYLAVNFTAPFLLSQCMFSGLPEDATGKVINLNDWRTARAKRFAYGASKAALSGLTRSLAVAMAPRVQVNELALGAILPPVDVVERPPEEMETGLGPAGRMGTLNEVARAVLALVENDFITGETLHIDGGRHIR